VLRKKEAKKEGRREESVGVLNIQLLAVKSLLHISSSSKCEEGKQYHEKMQFAHSKFKTYNLGTFAIEFLGRRKRGWSSSK
jgi:hypothetical protein